MERDTELNKLLENWEGEKITIRPSAVDNFMTCPRQWAMTFLGGVRSIPGGRAAIGTSIHKAIEEEWKIAIATGKKEFNTTAMADQAEANLVEQDQKEEGINFDLGEDISTASMEAAKGCNTFVTDIVPFTPIPAAVEERYTITLDNPVVACLSGTVDYITKDTIADVKTSKRKPVPSNHTTQQTIYKLLAEANGVDVKHSLIQGVVLKAKPEGHIMELEPDVPKAKFAVNTILDILTAFHDQKIRPDLLFRGNNKHYLCSDKYCAMYNTCPYVQGASK